MWAGVERQRHMPSLSVSIKPFLPFVCKSRPAVRASEYVITSYQDYMSDFIFPTEPDVCLFVCLKWSLVNFLYLQLLTGHNHAGIQESAPHLLIQNAMMSHEGQYTCVVTNSAGEDKKDFRITVQGGWSLLNHIYRPIIYLAEFCWKTNKQ